MLESDTQTSTIIIFISTMVTFKSFMQQYMLGFRIV